MPSTSTQEKPYTLGQLTKRLESLKEQALDMANGAYRIVHDIEDTEEAIAAWRTAGTRAG